MCPERITNNIFDIQPDEKIPAHIGDNVMIELSDLKCVRVDFYDEEDRVQTMAGDIYYVLHGIFPEK